MSATGRGTKRNENDFYATPDKVVDQIIEEIDWTEVHSFLEPCRGSGAIYDKVPKTRYKELEDTPVPTRPLMFHAELSEGIDYLKAYFSLPKPALILTNPPFSLAQEFVEKSLREADCVVYLQRLNWFGSKKRKEFWTKNPVTHLFVLSQRPSFTGKGTDACEYAWFVWDKTSKIMKRPKGIYVL